RVEAPAQLRGRDPSRKHPQLVERRGQVQLRQRTSEGSPSLDELSHLRALGITRSTSQQDAGLLEKLPHSRGAELVRKLAVVLMHRPTRKHVRARREVRTARSAHQQQLPRITIA